LYIQKRVDKNILLGGRGMKRKFINKIILGTMVSTTLFTLAPTKASAEWVNDYQGNWYYMQNNSKLTGWSKIDGQLYYFDDNGKMQKGWIKAGDSWYFIQSNGTLKTGWINYSNKWYYADSTGAIQTGIINIAGKIYIFDSNGIMQTSNTVINGEFYTIGADGEAAGSKVPTPDKELDGDGNVVRYINNTNTTAVGSPTDSKFNEVIEDKTESDEDPNQGRKFTVTFKDSNGAELESKSVKYEKTIDLYEPTKDGYKFGGWNTKSDGSGKSYDSSDSIKVKENTTLYAQWTEDTTVYADGITIKGNSYVTVNKTIQMTAEVSPSDVSSNAVTWSVTDTSGKATIDSNGILTGVSSGTVTVKATANDGSNVSATKDVSVTLSDVLVPVSQITVTSKTGASTITTDGGTLQMVASASPDDATNQGITWSVENRTGSASIDSNGLLTATSNGIVTVKATANDGSGVVGSTTITLSGQSAKINVDSVSISAQNSTTTDQLQITTDGGTLQLIANILPTAASNKGVQWSITSGQDKIKFSSNGLVTALANGIVTVQVKTFDGSKVDTKQITISNQSIKVSKITITEPLSISGAASQTMQATVVGNGTDNPTNSALKWTVQNKTGSASIDPVKGILTPASNGTVTVTATATDGSGVTDSKDVTISGVSSQIPVTSINVTGSDGSTNPSITKDDGTLDLVAAILPSYASTTSSAVSWQVVGGSDGGSASIVGATTGSTTQIKALTNGTVTVKATLTDVDGTKKTGSVMVSIDNQIQQVQAITINTPFNANGGNGKVGVGEGLLLTATVNGGDAKYKNVTWQVSNGSGDTGSANFDSKVNGLLKGVSKGTVTVTAISTDGYDTESTPIKIEVVDPVVPATTITVNAPTGSNNKITTNKGTLNMTASVSSDATSNVVAWSVSDPTKATIVDNGDSTATITAVENGDVSVIATGSGGIQGSQIINITGQDPTKLTLSGTGGATSINKIGGTLDVLCNLVPSNATTPASVVWTVSDTSKATIVSSDTSKATLKAVDNGTVTVTATATTANGTKLVASTPITINGVKSVTLGSSASAISNGGTVTLTAAVSPSNVQDGTVTWTVSDTSKATITTSSDTKAAVLTATGTGAVIVTATANGDPSKSASVTITIS
jgi:uncharacterized repeat protein (TIGR02543 family)